MQEVYKAAQEKNSQGEVQLLGIPILAYSFSLETSEEAIDINKIIS